MNFHCNHTEHDLIILSILAEQQRNHWAIKIEHRILKQTHDIKLAENLSPLTKDLEEVKKSTQKLGEVIRENKSTQLAIQNITGTQSLGDSLAFMKKSKNLNKLLEETNGEVSFGIIYLLNH